jgi:hypothetical protein
MTLNKVPNVDNLNGVVIPMRYEAIFGNSGDGSAVDPGTETLSSNGGGTSRNTKGARVFTDGTADAQALASFAPRISRSETGLHVIQIGFATGGNFVNFDHGFEAGLLDNANFDGNDIVAVQHDASGDRFRVDNLGTDTDDTNFDWKQNDKYHLSIVVDYENTECRVWRDDIPFVSEPDHIVNAVPDRPKGAGIRIADVSGGGNNDAEDARALYVSRYWVKGLDL